MNKNVKSDQRDQPQTSALKLPYAAPKLLAFGNVVALTAGGSFGSAEDKLADPEAQKP